MTRAETLQEAESAARSILRKHKIVGVPVDVGALCTGENISCVAKVLDDELSGMAFVRNSQRFVVVNASHHPNRQRFTIAHEMGHHILHADYLQNNVHVDTGVLRRDELSAEGIDYKEIGANAFAAEVLMPRSHMVQYSALDMADEVEVTNAAKRFAVSATAFAYRLANLASRG